MGAEQVVKAEAGDTVPAHARDAFDAVLASTPAVLALGASRWHDLHRRGIGRTDEEAIMDGGSVLGVRRS